MTEEEFLIRLKITNKVSAASKQNSGGIHSGKKVDRAMIRANYSPNFDVTDAAQDLIEFMVDLEMLQTRAHLRYLFKLSCLCVTTVSPRFPTVSVGSIDTSGHREQFSDVILPGESYLSCIPGSVALCGNEADLATFYLSLRFLRSSCIFKL